jgi:hypothetical protein
VTSPLRPVQRQTLGSGLLEEGKTGAMTRPGIDPLVEPSVHWQRAATERKSRNPRGLEPENAHQIVLLWNRCDSCLTQKRAEARARSVIP